ncbi:MAG TPA: DNA-3-methyladenine glycosylase [Chitinophagaceae bacterium]|nr:DNA-3-methyladenine glycosylase [Chitinophagaceae bacterium]
MNLPLKYSKLEPSFYLGEDVLSIAKSLLGKLLVSQINGEFTAGMIVETEAYRGVEDRASHAFNNRRTTRTEVMFARGGVAYVYLCYGIHHLFNVVTNREEVPHAILIRAIEPLFGKEIMQRRTDKKKWDHSIGSGPGNVTKALGIHTMHTGTSLNGDEVFIADYGISFQDPMIIATPRVGVDYAGEDAKLPYRFVIRDHPNVSAKTFTSKYTGT